MTKEWWQILVGEDAVEHYIQTHAPDFEPARVAHEVDVYIEAIRAFLPLDYSMAILDTYGGMGPHARELIRRGFTNVVTTDISHAMIRRSAQLAWNERLEPHLLFAVADARHLPFHDAGFEIVLACNTSYIGFFDNADDNIEVMVESRRVLNSGGLVIFDLVNEDYALTKLANIHTEQIIGENLIITNRKTYRSENGRAFTEFKEIVQPLAQKSPRSENNIRIEVFHPMRVEEMLHAAGFKRTHHWNRRFESDPTGRLLGTRGVKDLYIGIA